MFDAVRLSRGEAGLLRLWLEGALTAAQEESHGAALDEDGEDDEDVG